MKLIQQFTWLLLCACSLQLSAQKLKTAPENWQHLDYKINKVHGVSTQLAYEQLLKGKSGVPVVVAVIDGGTDITHEDLLENLWRNPGEIPNNGIDDDKNGYADDVYGWNFIGGKNGTHVDHDQYEYTRLYGKWFKKYLGLDSTKIAQLNSDELKEFKVFLRAQEKYDENLEAAKRILDRMQSNTRGVESILRQLKTREPSLEQVTQANAKTKDDLNGKALLIKMISNHVTPDELLANLENYKNHYQKEVDFYLNINYNSRVIVGDAYEAANQKNYGNNDVKGPDASHGTHVAGIIGAVRGNGLGMEGIAQQVKIMTVRVVPDGDERDKDVANAIYYAVQNGAKVINMSFGKNFVYNKKVVDEAVKFAMKRDVLMIHAAGNNAENNDTTPHYPTNLYEDDTLFAKGWIEVGASTWKEKKFLAAEFSNYGEKSVDVFAPGYEINSTYPDSNVYKALSGTSMACPVTAGVAAVIRSQFPLLSAVQVKEAIEKSVVPIKGKVYMPSEGGKPKKVKFKKLCKTGGIVNLYKALQYAATMTPEIQPKN